MKNVTKMIFIALLALTGFEMQALSPNLPSKPSNSDSAPLDLGYVSINFKDASGKRIGSAELNQKPMTLLKSNIPANTASIELHPYVEIDGSGRKAGKITIQL